VRSAPARQLSIRGVPEGVPVPARFAHTFPSTDDHFLGVPNHPRGSVGGGLDETSSRASLGAGTKTRDHLGSAPGCRARGDERGRDGDAEDVGEARVRAEAVTRSRPS
jgi:hypothetical protein